MSRENNKPYRDIQHLLLYLGIAQGCSHFLFQILIYLHFIALKSFLASYFRFQKVVIKKKHFCIYLKNIDPIYKLIINLSHSKSVFFYFIIFDMKFHFLYDISSCYFKRLNANSSREYRVRLIKRPCPHARIKRQIRYNS